MRKYVAIVLLLISSLAFAETDYKLYTREDAEKLATAMGVVYVGMPKEELYKVYTNQKGYYKEDNEEWISFSDWMTDESGDLISFYLKDGKVKGWKDK